MDIREFAQEFQENIKMAIEMGKTDPNPMDIIRHVVLQVVFFYMNSLEKCYKYIVPFVE